MPELWTPAATLAVGGVAGVAGALASVAAKTVSVAVGGGGGRNATNTTQAPPAFATTEEAPGGPKDFIFVIVFLCAASIGFVVLVAFCTRYASSKSERRAERYLFEVQERRRISAETAALKVERGAPLRQSAVPQITIDHCSS